MHQMFTDQELARMLSLISMDEKNFSLRFLSDLSIVDPALTSVPAESHSEGHEWLPEADCLLHG